MTARLARPRQSDLIRMVSNPAEIEALLTSPRFDVVDYPARYAHLARALNLDFSHILRTLQFVPACLDTARHSSVRQQIGELIKERQIMVRSMGPLILDTLLQPLHSPGEFDLVAMVLEPFVEKTLRLLSGVETTAQAVEHARFSDLFGQNVGITRRKRLNDQLGSVWEWLDQVYANEPESRRGVRLALIILGTDATLGTLAGSLQAALTDCPTQLSAIQYPAVPTRTGVPYIDRTAVAANSTSGSTWAAGSFARLRLDAFEADTLSNERHRMFGTGPHACLGRVIATNMWQALALKLCSLPGRVEFERLTWHRSDLLRIPDQLVVRILHD